MLTLGFNVKALEVADFADSCKSIKDYKVFESTIKKEYRAGLDKVYSGLVPQITSSYSNNEAINSNVEKAKIGLSLLNIKPFEIKRNYKNLRYKFLSGVYKNRYDKRLFRDMIVSLVLEHKYRKRLDLEFKRNRSLISSIGLSLNVNKLSNKQIKSYLSKQRLFQIFLENSERLTYLANILRDCDRYGQIEKVRINILDQKHKNEKLDLYSRFCMNKKKELYTKYLKNTSFVQPALFGGISRVFPAGKEREYVEWSFGINLSFNFGERNKTGFNYHPCNGAHRELKAIDESSKSMRSQYIDQLKNSKKILERLDSFSKSLSKVNKKTSQYFDDYLVYIDNLDKTLNNIWKYEQLLVID